MGIFTAAATDPASAASPRPPGIEPGLDAGAQKRRAQNAYHKAKSADDRDIAAKFKWEPADLSRREACRYDLRLFLETYFPGTFPHCFSPTHLHLIEMAQEAILHGGLHCISFFRGAGKTSVLARAVLWAIAYGHRRYAVIVGATDELAAEMMDVHIRSELTDNEILRGDFPELCNPFVALEGHGRKCAGQVFEGQRTFIKWSDGKLVCAEFKWSIERGNGGSVIVVKSITGAMKGKTAKLRYNGETIRPDILLLDDIQTRESAGSPVSTKKRVQTVQGDALGLAGHDRKIAAVQAVTPIFANDLACQFLDRARMPEWRGITTSMVVAMPEREDLWDEYRSILHEALRNDGDAKAAERFYIENRAEMDRGAAMAWPERVPKGYLSALQYAMELKFRDPEAFAGEYQCRPLEIEASAGIMLSREAIAGKTNGLKKGIVPPETDYLTAFLDVNDAYLFYGICAFSKTFQGACIEYSAWPPQNKRYYSKGEASPTLAAYLAAEDANLAGSPIKTLLAAALDLAIAELLDRTWQDAAGHVFAINQLLVDTAYEADVVRGAIARLKQPSERLPRVMPSHGVGYGAKSKPMAELVKKPGDIVGCHWRAAQPDAGKTRVVSVDTNYWKTTLHQQFASPLGQNGCFALYGDKRTDHALAADHLTSENPNRLTNETKGKEQTVIEWILKPNRENETLDCIVGCFVGASMRGSELTGAAGVERKAGRKRRPIGELMGGTQ